jgi:hypothetical protein
VSGLDLVAERKWVMRRIIIGVNRLLYYIFPEMSTDEFNRKLEEGRKLGAELRKDLKNRADKLQRGETTYQEDAEIVGSFRTFVHLC